MLGSVQPASVTEEVHEHAGIGAFACIVIPCFNEAARLDREALIGLAADPSVRLLFVDDGSTDSTRDVLNDLSSRSDSIEVLGLRQNRGKAEAVRQGMIRALEGTAPLVGYYDADLATPPSELVRLVAALMNHPGTEVVLGARVAMLGRSIDRHAHRHYAGRLFATAASVALGIGVYDTQCGAKVFRRSPALVAATSAPFRSDWAFDVELLDRLLRGSTAAEPVPVSAFREMPLEAWRDVAGSQMRWSASVAALLAVGRIGRDRRRAARR